MFSKSLWIHYLSKINFLHFKIICRGLNVHMSPHLCWDAVTHMMICKGGKTRRWGGTEDRDYMSDNPVLIKRSSESWLTNHYLWIRAPGNSLSWASQHGQPWETNCCCLLFMVYCILFWYYIPYIKYIVPNRPFLSFRKN